MVHFIKLFSNQIGWDGVVSQCSYMLFKMTLIVEQIFSSSSQEIAN